MTARKTGPTAFVEFDVRDPYPALKTIDYLMKVLAERGWAIAGQLAFGSSLRDEPLRSVAVHYRGRHVWEARWRDSEGNEITYRLVYDCPLEQHGMHSVYAHASGSRYGKQEAAKREAERQRVLEAERRRKRGEFCADLRIRLSSAVLFCE